ncbi:MAG: hypothetical protein FP820_05185 [Sulfurimonas sp.]|jgi:hypothetical protein|nr:hypothetical protein [Sulfurimonas sp.]MBU1217332.1 hypothetical protein [bacterium]MBU1433865.1 hypothetical protein [bacterium]MBU1503563.1 hypothetical protein [bacterium]MBU3939733.1 hypothetical protein [bacterium]
MIRINWDEYKEYKRHSHKEDNFEILLDFFKSFYNVVNPYDIYDSLAEDDLGKMMLEKRDIRDAEDMENYLLKTK